MKKHRMPFAYWDDDHTRMIRESKPPEFVDPDYYVEAHMRGVQGSPLYFLNKRCHALLKKHGPFTDHYRGDDELVDRFSGQDAYIFCPGPSMADVDLERFRGCLSFAVNSAAFAFTPVYWVMAESAYARWLVSQELDISPASHRIICTARVAVVLREWERQTGEEFSRVYVCRWEEEKIVPPRVPAVSVFNALVTAWQAGCKRAYLIGLDLSKEAGAYVSGVPYTKEGAENPFHDQIRALQQFSMPGLEVFNGSPSSRDLLPFQFVDYKEMPG